jgi:hypothetical protein
VSQLKTGSYHSRLQQKPEPGRYPEIVPARRIRVKNQNYTAYSAEHVLSVRDRLYQPWTPKDYGA